MIENQNEILKPKRKIEVNQLLSKLTQEILTLRISVLILRLGEMISDWRIDLEALIWSGSQCPSQIECYSQNRKQSYFLSWMDEKTNQGGINIIEEKKINDPRLCQLLKFGTFISHIIEVLKNIFSFRISHSSCGISLILFFDKLRFLRSLKAPMLTGSWAILLLERSRFRRLPATFN